MANVTLVFINVILKKRASIPCPSWSSPSRQSRSARRTNIFCREDGENDTRLHKKRFSRRGGGNIRCGEGKVWKGSIKISLDLLSYSQSYKLTWFSTSLHIYIFYGRFVPCMNKSKKHAVKSGWETLWSLMFTAFHFWKDSATRLNIKVSICISWE